jgi:hypothetical protein
MADLLTPEERRLVEQLPRQQPGCPVPGCYSCQQNHARERALQKLLAAYDSDRQREAQLLEVIQTTDALVDQRGGSLVERAQGYDSLRELLFGASSMSEIRTPDQQPPSDIPDTFEAPPHE